MALEEDFSDVAGYVQEDESFVEESEGEDEIDRKIAEEHAKFKEAVAKRQEEVRASRPWSTTPMESPRPEQQKERERERQSRASVTAEGSPPEVPRTEYEPPPRPYLALQGQASGGTLSYLAPPASRPTSAATERSRLSMNGRGPTLQGIEEEGTEPAVSSRQDSEAGRGPRDGSGGEAEDVAAPAPLPEEDAEPVAEEPSERAGSAEGEEDRAGGGDGYGGRAREEEEEPYVPEPLAEEAAEEVAEEGEQEEEQPNRWGGGGSGSASQSASQRRASHDYANAAPAMAMRGFVEPLTYDDSEGGGGREGDEAEAEPSAARGEDSAPGRRSGDGSAKADEEEDEGYGEDSFEEAGEEGEGGQTPAAEPSSRSTVPPGAASERSYSSTPLVPPRPDSALSAADPARPTPSLALGKALTHGEQEEEDDQQLFARAAAVAVQRASANGAAARAKAPVPPPPPAAELMPPQQFAMQLLKHDIETLPAHHKAAAESAAQRRRPTSARPAGAGLAAFGYLGYHVPPDTLTAPTGPGFRTSANGSPGAGKVPSPGRGSDAGANPSPAAGSPRDSSSGADGRPLSAPHARPGAGGAAATDTGGMSTSTFLGAARDLRAGGKAAGAGGGGGAARPRSAVPKPPPAPPSGGGRDLGVEKSMSVLGEDEAYSANNRIKFDVWLDALSGKQQPQPRDSSSGGASRATAASGNTGSSSRTRPMTAPASGRRRPVSARPAATTTVAGGSIGAGVYGAPHNVTIPRPLGRPMSAQPAYMTRPASAGRSQQPLVGYDPGVGVGVGVMGSGLYAEPTVPVTVHPMGSAAAAAVPTAAVDVAGVTVSVYVADTLKRIVEANRWLQQLGVATKRYRLKDRYSNMTVQLVEEQPPEEQERAARGDGDDDELPYGQYTNRGGGRAGAVVKELTLKQFLSGHARLKQQARRVRQAAAPPLPGAGSPGGGTFGAGEGGGRARPFSAGPGGRSSGGAGGRPASAAPAWASGGGAGEQHAGPGGGAHQYGGGRHVPARPSSANPSYGRTPVPYSAAGGSPPGGRGSGGGLGPTVHASVPTSLPAKAAWGGAAAEGQQGELPYYVRSVSAHDRGGGRSSLATHPHAFIEEDDDEEEVIVDADADGDVTDSVRYHLGAAVAGCRARRQEINRLRHAPVV